jgi:uncharacterized membrane protein YGL010W
MSRVEQKLAAYAAYHRDARNIATHMLGIPMIVFAVEVLLSRPAFMLGPVPLTPAVPASLLAAYYYFRLDTGLACALTAFLALCAWAGFGLAALSTTAWLAAGGGIFALGWVLQFIGHGFEGRKPAFFDDLTSLLIGPLFIMAECGFRLGLRRGLQAAVAAQNNQAV